MKIRIKDNSLRFRLTQSEVAELGKNGMISGSTEFPGRNFVYAIERTEDGNLSAVFTDNRMVLKMPAVMVEEWISTDTVGFNGQAGKISLLVEKDFVCLDNTLEDQSDNYPNPNAKC
ncbi:MULTISPECIES: DUF7009 family protein [Chryseobacterium]|uniref:Uncharacterized protein n=1 Tax=Chryseobacterium camelliae TaxID=1265445 RepID=A0ABU0TIL4_9FLAO|nr:MULTISPECIES: hypothetical protein [Chryseobacterium]MDT3409242.1 hypothetical protein [Pseudacidovorax intermedius]MDQ1096896.1 hypothetical protein [Chryseobacterium camelliae]MDQ1100838.1 hypothetical protein [Chryseobacterium sp. SORGH_AS_1048]MDR6084280.1 hypothetical protein [Chryseobacterium sp. SORGH_AS_0909]MDR6132551.1 hypothetical protein [Chryseobacterium sp. SORGH_AS_1175]